MASRLSTTIDKSKCCNRCYQYKHSRCTGVRKDQGNKPCECTKCDNKTINNPIPIL